MPSLGDSSSLRVTLQALRGSDAVCNLPAAEACQHASGVQAAAARPMH